MKDSQRGQARRTPGLAPADTHGRALRYTQRHPHRGTHRCTLTDVCPQKLMSQGAHTQEYAQNTLKEVQTQITNSSLREHTNTQTRTYV